MPPKTALGQALQSLHRQWPRLIAYLDEGQYPLDNNQAEKMGFFVTVWPVPTKVNDLNPYDYLKQLFT